MSIRTRDLDPQVRMAECCQSYNNRELKNHDDGLVDDDRK